MPEGGFYSCCNPGFVIMCTVCFLELKILKYVLRMLLKTVLTSSSIKTAMHGKREINNNNTTAFSDKSSTLTAISSQLRFYCMNIWINIVSIIGSH